MLMMRGYSVSPPTANPVHMTYASVRILLLLLLLLFTPWTCQFVSMNVGPNLNGEWHAMGKDTSKFSPYRLLAAEYYDTVPESSHVIELMNPPAMFVCHDAFSFLPSTHRSHYNLLSLSWPSLLSHLSIFAQPRHFTRFHDVDALGKCNFIL